VKQSSGILQAIEEHKRSLESCSQSLKGLHLKTDTVNTHSSTLQSDLVKQERVIEETNSRTMRIREQTSRIEEAAQETSSSLAVINQQNDSILHGTTQILSMVTSGLITINSIGEQIYRLFQMFTTFNAEMRAYAQYML
jgi:chromosome segregation ATPase